jgi:hypothetical protein
MHDPSVCAPRFVPACPCKGVIYGQGDWAIVSGYTPPAAIADRVGIPSFAAIFPLHACGEIDPIVRNILANPWLTGAIALELTDADAASGAIAQLSRLWLSFRYVRQREFQPFLRDDITPEHLYKLQRIPYFCLNDKESGFPLAFLSGLVQRHRCSDPYFLPLILPPP